MHFGTAITFLSYPNDLLTAMFALKVALYFHYTVVLIKRVVCLVEGFETPPGVGTAFHGTLADNKGTNRD
ncbi:MAG: hypothetical protein STSR0004_11410 [Peptococcaceae bacterium]